MCLLYVPSSHKLLVKGTSAHKRQYEKTLLPLTLKGLGAFTKVVFQASTVHHTFCGKLPRTWCHNGLHPTHHFLQSAVLSTLPRLLPGIIIHIATTYVYIKVHLSSSAQPCVVDTTCNSGLINHCNAPFSSWPVGYAACVNISATHAL